MRTVLKITQVLFAAAQADLGRPHKFAYERVGFFRCRFATAQPAILALVHDYHPVADEDYIDDDRFGAVINGDAFRKSLQLAYSSACGILHVHMHDHVGVPSPSGIDLRETRAFVPDFFNVRPDVPHGALILSRNALCGTLWNPLDRKPREFDRIDIVGPGMRSWVART